MVLIKWVRLTDILCIKRVFYDVKQSRKLNVQVPKVEKGN